MSSSTTASLMASSIVLGQGMTITGQIMGLDIQAMVLGTIAAAFMLGIDKVRSPIQGIYQVLLSALAAGALTPLLSKFIGFYILEYKNWEIEGTHGMLNTAIAVIIGAFFQLIYPIIFDGLRSFFVRKNRPYRKEPYYRSENEENDYE